MDETIVIKFASYLRWALKPAHYEVQILEKVSSTLGAFRWWYLCTVTAVC